MKNFGQHDVKVVLTHPLALCEITVVLADGRAVPLTLFGKQQTENSKDGSVSLRVLKPGEEVSSNVELNRLFDMSLDAQYTVSLRRQMLVDRLDGQFTQAKSNALQITVSEAERIRATRGQKDDTQ